MANGVPENDRCGVRIEISPQLLAKMIHDGSIFPADIRCLDPQSKRQVWRACLESTLKA